MGNSPTATIMLCSCLARAVVQWLNLSNTTKGHQMRSLYGIRRLQIPFPVLTLFASSSLSNGSESRVSFHYRLGFRGAVFSIARPPNRPPKAPNSPHQVGDHFFPPSTTSSQFFGVGVDPSSPCAPPIELATLPPLNSWDATG